MKYKIGRQIYRWLFGWAQVFDGLACVLTLGFWMPGLGLSTATRAARYRFKHGPR